MDFEVTPEQQELVDSVRSVLAQECPPALVRDVVENGSAPEQPWKSARELGCQLVYHEEMAKIRAERTANPQGLGIIAPSLHDYASGLLKEKTCGRRCAPRSPGAWA